MKKHIYILGLVTMGMLVLGGFGIPLLAQDPGPFGDSPPPGTYSIDLDFGIDSTWTVGPTLSTPSGKVNTNLRYSLTEARTPADQYINVGFVAGEEGAPDFKIDGTLVGSELFVKIVNDQTSPMTGERLIDWQAALILGSAINVSWKFPEGGPISAGMGAQLPPDTGPGIPMELLPTNFVFPLGSSTPPMPVVRSPTNFSYASELGNLAQAFGYHDGFPAITPGMFFLDDLTKADAFWDNVANYLDVLPQSEGDDNATWDVTSTLATDYNLTIDGRHFNGTTGTTWETVNLSALWDSTGLLTRFGINVKSDTNHNGAFDTNEEVYFLFDLVTPVVQPSIPVQIGDKGEYTMAVDFSASVSIPDNASLESDINTMLTAITDSINLLNGEMLMNFTVDSMDGLYIHVDGMMLDFTGFLMYQLGSTFGEPGPAGWGAQQFPTIDDFYHPIGGGGGGDWGWDEFAVNLFDATPYMNSTYYLRTSHNVYPENDTYLKLNHHEPGMTWATAYNSSEWDNAWFLHTEESSTSFDPDWDIWDNMASLSGKEEYSGPVQYVQFWDPVWNQMFVDPVLDAPAGTFDPFRPYTTVLEVSEIPTADEWRTYRTMGEGGLPIPIGDPEGTGGPIGWGAQDEGMNIMGVDPNQLQQMTPMPIRTPDWNVIGGEMTFVEAVVDAIADVVTSPDFIDVVEAAMLGDPDTGLTGPGEFVDITVFTFGLDWISNTTHKGAKATSALSLDAAENITEEYLFQEMSIDYTSSIENFWNPTGTFLTASTTWGIELFFDVTDYYVEPTVDTTTTTTDPGLSPGFEIFMVFGALIVLPVIVRRRR